MNIWEYLRIIKEALEQIDTITQNQMTLIISDVEDNESETLDFMNEMIQNKEEIMNELEHYEKLFQEEYNKQRDMLINSGEMREIKTEVTKILQLKEIIVEHERSNLMIMQAKTNKKPKSINISPAASKVVAAYQKQSKIEQI